MKVLIYFNKRDLKPVGGPSGYLYNIYKQIIENENIEIDFLDYEQQSKRKKICYKMISKLPNRLKNKVELYIKHRYTKHILEDVFGSKERKTIIDINQYDIVHFNDTLSLYLSKDSLEKFNGKVVLTSHSPKPFHKEIIEDNLLKKDYIKYKELFDKLDLFDEYAFNRADYIIFPCEEAEEPYFNQWSRYKEIHDNNINKYRYLLTGTKQCKANISKECIREKYNIPKEAFIVSYVGRHNEVKGYKDLKKVAKKLLGKDRKIYFLIAGKEGPLYGINDSNWIEVGWTNDPHSIINASDMFILPNRETYFDLVLLEVMSLGIPVLASYTGGNKYFEKINDSGIYFFKDMNEAMKRIIEFSNMDRIELEKIGYKNKVIFQKEFNEKIFYKNYVEMMRKIYNEK